MEENNKKMIGRYQLLAKLATGGMAEIFLARQTGIGGFEKLVVVKRILSHLANEEAFVEMFLDEAVIAAQLNHPNVVQIYDLGQANDDYFIAMEFLEGESLGYLVSEGQKKGKPLPPELAASIVSKVSDGLYYAHTFEDDSGQPLNIVHRDISPHNIIVLFSGSVKLVDFGIAKAATKMHHTRVGTIKGKLAYMSPEQCLGKTVDARSDIFSLGVVMYELLTTRRLFKRDSEPAMIRAIVDEDIPKVLDVKPDIPKGLAEVVDTALAKEKDERFRNAAEMANAIRSCLSDMGVQAEAQEIATYSTSVFEESARTKKKLLAEIDEKGVDGVELRVVKPKSESMPSQSGEKDAKPEAKKPTPEELAAAQEPTQLRPSLDDEEKDDGEPKVKYPVPGYQGVIVDPEAVNPTMDLPAVTDVPEPKSGGGALKIVIPLVLVLIVGAGAFWFFTQGDKGTTGPSDPQQLNKPTDPIAKPTDPIAKPTDPKPSDPVAKQEEPQAAADAGVDGGTAEAQDGGLPDGTAVAQVIEPKVKPDTVKDPDPVVKPKPKPKPRPKPKPKPKPKQIGGKGKLRLKTKPWSDIYLGKKKLGMTPLVGFELPAGTHTLTAVNKGKGISKSIVVKIQKGKTTTMKVNLAK